MNILITGATGFIGSNLVKRLVSKKINVFCTLLDHETNPYQDFGVVSVYFSTLAEVDRIAFFKNNSIDGIIHLASYVQSSDHTEADIEKLISSNILFGTYLLESASKANVKWFINTGTYWQNFNNEDYSPVNMYAATKQAFMDIAKYYIDTNKIKFATIKLFDTYGENDNRPKIFNLWSKISKTGETLDMSPGNQLIDISHISDIVSAFDLLAIKLDNKSIEIQNGGVYAVLAEKRYTVRELASIFEESTGAKLNINWGGRPYKEREIMAPYAKGVVVPGWKPLVTIEVGIKSFY